MREVVEVCGGMWASGYKYALKSNNLEVTNCPSFLMIGRHSCGCSIVGCAPFNRVLFLAGKGR